MCLGYFAMGCLIFVYQAWLFQRFAIRIDAEGLWCRHHFTWNLWSWQDMQHGRIQRSDADRIVDNQRPWWRQTLDLRMLPRHDADELRRSIFALIPTPPTPALPEEARIVVGLFRRASISKEGFTLDVNLPAKAKHYKWDSVTIHLWKTYHDSTACCRVELHIDGAKKPIKVLLETPIEWRNVDRRQFTLFLETQVPARCLLIDATDSPPRNVPEADRRLLAIRKDRRESRQVIWIINLFIVIVALSLLIDKIVTAKPIPMTWWVWVYLAFLLVGFLLICALPMVIYIGNKRWNARIEEQLQLQRDHLSGESQSQS